MMTEVRISDYPAGVDDETYWGAVRSVRLDIADLLTTLTPAQWDTESLCPGWRMREVAGHLALVPTITTWDMVRAAPRGGFNPNRINTVLARRHGSAPTTSIVAELRTHAGDRCTARVLDVRNSLFDAIVHSQDIARPLGLSFDVDPQFVVMGLDRVWQMGWPFRARERLTGLTLQAPTRAGRQARARWSAVPHWICCSCSPGVMTRYATESPVCPDIAGLT